MRYQEYIIKQTQAAADEAFRYALAVPEDKREWKPLDAGRSVLDQAREMARCPLWARQIVGDEQVDWGEESQKREFEEMSKLATVEECQRECNERLQELFELYRRFPDERLKDTKWLPFDGGREFTYEEMMDYPRWNFNYHLGQIAYIQVLYGDKAMH